MSEAARLDEEVARSLGRANIRAGASVVIDATTEAIWAALVDVESWGDWYRGVTEVKGTSPLTPSSTFQFKAGPAAIDARIERMVHGEELRFAGSSLGVKSVYLFRLSPQGDQVRVDAAQTMGGLAAMAMKMMLQGVTEKAVVRWLDALKRHVEATH